jgi:hypothetical protein
VYLRAEVGQDIALVPWMFFLPPQDSMSTGRMISVPGEGEEVTRGVGGVVVSHTITKASNTPYFPVPRDTFSVKFPWKINGPLLIEFFHRAGEI